ncbi:tetratricopeptide repeat protein [Flagellimonas allohymeniacidonis]|uniref:Tetratricopeptide repeat protein n=1 Tax=Flagellimonas allohymeniacidonis TaxID=2517819 RepID=A0A4V2HSR0_9FLAO|nr:tetratricopeptide repeat protein [Allomuricauda hymeniacidonis]TAI48690.1 tetratricopeptide repeat protein [Allomuricauda hymeniacidonis]
MKRIFLALMVFLSTMGHLHAQSLEEINSLIDTLEFGKSTPVEKVNILNQLGYNYWVIDSQKSLEYGNQALSLALEQDYKSGIAMAQRVLGVAYWTQGHPKKALENLNDSQTVYLEIGDSEGATNALMNSGMVYADIEEYSKALEVYNKAIDTYTALNLTDRIATTFTKIGTVLMEQKQYPEAKEYLTNALKIHSENNFEYGQAEAHNRLGRLNLNLGQLELASYHLGRALELSTKIDDEDGLLSSTIQMGRLHRLRGEFPQAEEILIASYADANLKKLRKYKLSALRELKLLRKEEGNLREALILYDEFILLKDSIFNATKSKQIAALAFDNELRQKQQEIALLKENEQVQNLTNLLLSLGLIAISTIGFLMFRHQKVKNNKNKELIAQQKQLSQSKEALAKTELENAHLKEQELQNKLNFKNKELTSYTLNFVQKNQLLAQLEQQINELGKGGKDMEKKVLELKRTLKINTNMDRDWQDFRRFFEEVHSTFISRLNEKHPEVSSNDLKIAALVRLNLNVKESASILGISPESAKTARYRLRKKLELQPEQELLDYFLQLERDI